MNPKKILQFSIGPLGASALSLLTLPFIAWFFTVEDVGRLTMLHVILGLSSSIIGLQMHQSYVREYHEQNDKKLLFKVALIPAMVIFSLIVLISLILPYSISEILFGIDSDTLTIYLFIALFSSVIINLLAHVLRMQERGLAFSLTQIAPKLILIVLIGCIYIFNFPNEFVVLMAMNTIALLTSLFVLLWLTRQTWLVALGKPINFELLQNMLRFSLPLVAGGLAYWGLTTMDRFFLRAYSGFEELGVYALSVSLAAGVSVVSALFSNLWHPIVYKWIKDGIEINKVRMVTESMLLLVAIIWTFVGLNSWVLLNFLPEDYISIEYLIVACVSMPLFYMLSETTVVGIGITRRSSFSMLASVVSFLINAILNYLLIPDYGASGAALASMIAFFVFFLIRTEASSFLWESIPRIKIYFVVLMYISATIVMVFTENKIGGFSYLWVFILFITLLLFWVRVEELYQILNNYIARKS